MKRTKKLLINTQNGIDPAAFGDAETPVTGFIGVITAIEHIGDAADVTAAAAAEWQKVGVRVEVDFVNGTIQPIKE